MLCSFMCHDTIASVEFNQNHFRLQSKHKHSTRKVAQARTYDLQNRECKH
eukprot:c48160_g1_i1 orf=73-222(+)